MCGVRVRWRVRVCVGLRLVGPPRSWPAHAHAHTVTVSVMRACAVQGVRAQCVCARARAQAKPEGPPSAGPCAHAHAHAHAQSQSVGQVRGGALHFASRRVRMCARDELTAGGGAGSRACAPRTSRRGGPPMLFVLVCVWSLIADVRTHISFCFGFNFAKIVFVEMTCDTRGLRRIEVFETGCVRAKPGVRKRRCVAGQTGLARGAGA